MKKLKAVIVVIVVLVAATAYAWGVLCPYDNFNMYFTGQTKTEWGKLVYLYKCPAGHTAWVVQ